MTLIDGGGEGRYRCSHYGSGRGVSSVITRKAPDGKGYQPRLQVRPARIKGQRRSLRPRPPLSNATQRGEPGCQKLTFYPAGRKEKQQTPAPRRRSSSPSAETIRPSCQGAHNAGPIFAPASAKTSALASGCAAVLPNISAPVNPIALLVKSEFV